MSIPLMAVPWIYLGYGAVVLAMRKLRGGRGKDWLFALVNLATVFCIHFAARDPRAGLIFWVYLGVMVMMYPAASFLVARPRFFWWGFFLPIFFLVAVRYVPTRWEAVGMPGLQEVLRRNPDFSLAPYFVGLSYLAFRCSRMWIDVRNGTTMPTFSQYLGFVFFFPVMSVGPIHRWPDHRAALEKPTEFPIGMCLQRIVVGLAKAVFLAGWAGQLAYSQIFFDGHLHRWLDLPIAAVAYFLYLYLNFSGYCDLAIGLAGLAGVPVPENFRSPLLARNLKEFWNRWHITLSEWMRDLVFSPLSKTVVRWVGPKQANHGIAGCILVVFLLIGIWHGKGWNFAVYGLLHGVGVVTVHYYGLVLKKWLGLARYRAYLANRWVEGIGIIVTGVYVAGTLFFMANTPRQMGEILHALR